MSISTLVKKVSPKLCGLLLVAATSLLAVPAIAQNPYQVPSHTFNDQNGVVTNSIPVSAVSMTLNDYRIGNSCGCTSPQYYGNSYGGHAQAGCNGGWVPKPMPFDWLTGHGTNTKLPTGRRYIHGSRYYGPLNNRFYGPQYGNF